MKLDDRIAQLAEYGVQFTSRPLLEDDKFFSGDIVARFGSDGLEYVEPPQRGLPEVAEYVKKTDGLYRVLKAEVGEAVAKRTFDHGLLQTGAIISIETHKIIDDQNGMLFSFKLPSRGYAAIPTSMAGRE